MNRSPINVSLTATEKAAKKARHAQIKLNEATGAYPKFKAEMVKRFGRWWQYENEAANAIGWKLQCGKLTLAQAMTAIVGCDSDYERWEDLEETRDGFLAMTRA